MPITNGATTIVEHLQAVSDACYQTVNMVAMFLLSIVSPQGEERRRPMIEQRWKAMSAFLGTVTVLITLAFGAGIAWQTIRAEASVIPNKLEALEGRVDAIESVTRSSAELLQDLVCDIRRERNEFDAACVRQLPPPYIYSPGGDT